MFGEIKSLNGPSGRTITNLAHEYRRYHRDPDRSKNLSSTIPQKRERDDASLHQSKATSTADAVAPSSTTDGTTPVDKTDVKREFKMNNAKSSTTIDLTNNAPTITAIEGTKLPEISMPKATQATQLPDIKSMNKAGRLLGLEEKIDRLLGLEGKIDRLLGLEEKIDRLLELESKIDRLIGLGGKIEGPQGLERKINQLAELGPRVEAFLNSLDFLVGIEDP
ncbi:uncharacterized protein Triagg1_2489 [Trichoderma aggressivum f. europaeum]|uniref:Uncharacterized protein n=1 Tax=Trichoderma aggressivum f. europaeum TaxID=173218 RepID=A0AAE1IH37_9HYPO|nr:hypothetical protein Triagg1_2489 [Trichoderma aggressivum f. europaeum]